MTQSETKNESDEKKSGSPQKTELPYWQWVKETPVAILEENESPAWGSPDDVVKAVRAMGAELMRYPAIRWGVHSFDDSKFLPKYPGLDERDLFGEIYAAMKAEGIKVMAYCHYGVIHTHAARLHPEWLAKNADGTLPRWNGEDHHYRTCMANEVFTSAMQGAILELCEKYDIDALYLDGPTWYGDCWCEHCRSKYQERHGEAMPEKLSFEDNSQQKYNLIRNDAIEKIVKDLKSELGEDRKLPLLFNMTLKYLPTHRTGIPERTMEWADGGNTTEIHRPGSFWKMYQNVRLGEALGKVSMGYLPPGPYETLRNFATPEIEFFGRAYLMHGATPMLNTVSTFINDTTAGSVMREVVKSYSAHPEIYHRSAPVKEIGLVYSRTSYKNFAGYDLDKMNPKFSGAFRALLNEQVHFDAFFDTQISAEKLKGYKALFIPGGISLQEKALDAIRNYVREGGSLLATGKFTLIDETGKALSNFAASDLLGVKFQGETPSAPYRTREYRETGPVHGYSLVPEAYLKIKDQRLAGIVPAENQLTPASYAQAGIGGLKRWIDYAFVKAQEGTEILADLFLPSGGAFGKALEFPYGTPPGITLNHYGQGRVIYVAFPIEEFYERRRLQETRKLLKELFRMLVGGDFAVEVDAPPGVIINFTQNGDRSFLHLLNYTGTMQEDSHALEWIAPIRNISVKVAERAPIERIQLLEASTDISFERTGSSISFKLPELNVFETVILK
jgi:putative glycosyl hydrolase-like family 6 (GHL6) protein